MRPPLSLCTYPPTRVGNPAGLRCKRGFEVVDEVVDRLDADREAYQRRRHCERRVRGGRVRHPRRVLDEALDSAEALGELPDLRPRDEVDCFLLVLEQER